MIPSKVETKNLGGHSIQEVMTTRIIDFIMENIDEDRLKGIIDEHYSGESLPSLLSNEGEDYQRLAQDIITQYIGRLNKVRQGRNISMLDEGTMDEARVRALMDSLNSDNENPDLRDAALIVLYVKEPLRKMPPDQLVTKFYELIGKQVPRVETPQLRELKGLLSSFYECMSREGDIILI